MNTADHIALVGLRAAANGGASFCEGLAEDLAADSTTSELHPARAVAVAHATAAAKHLKDAQLEMRRLMGAIDRMEDNVQTNATAP